MGKLFTRPSACRKPTEAFARAGIPPAEGRPQSAAGAKRALEADSSSGAAEIPAETKRRGGNGDGTVSYALAEAASGELGERNAFVDGVGDVLRRGSWEEAFGDARLLRGWDVGS